MSLDAKKQTDIIHIYMSNLVHFVKIHDLYIKLNLPFHNT